MLGGGCGRGGGGRGGGGGGGGAGAGGGGGRGRRRRGAARAGAAAERIGGRILEVGVGTGISLPDYKRTSRVCGVDISEPMLRKAQERVTDLGLSNVEGLWVMDAEKLTFPDASFDVVVAQYVITTVPNPE